MVRAQTFNIGIDLDNVITQTLKGLDDFLEENGITLSLEEKKGLARGKAINDNVKAFFEERVGTVSQNFEIMPGAVKVMEWLKIFGYKIYIITARDDKAYKNAAISTYKYLKKHDVPFDAIVFGAHDKAAVCRDKDIILHIDDSIETCESIAATTDCEVILFTSALNKDYKTDLPRASGWEDIRQLLIPIMAAHFNPSLEIPIMPVHFNPSLEEKYHFKYTF